MPHVPPMNASFRPLYTNRTAKPLRAAGASPRTRSADAGPRTWIDPRADDRDVHVTGLAPGARMRGAILAGLLVMSIAGCPSAPSGEGRSAGDNDNSGSGANGNSNVNDNTAPAPAGPFQLGVTVEGGGSVDPAGGAFEAGQVVELTATPDDGWRFSRWEGDVDEADALSNPLSIVLDADAALTAVFTTRPADGRWPGQTEDGTLFKMLVAGDGAEITLLLFRIEQEGATTTLSQTRLIDDPLAIDADAASGSFSYSDDAAAVAGAFGTPFEAAGTLSVDDPGTGITPPVEAGLTWTATWTDEPNSPPQASFTFRELAPLRLLFEAEVDDSDGSAVTQSFDLGDGSEPDPGRIADHTYAGPGTYVVTFTAVDDEGAETTVEQTVDVDGG